MSRPPISGSEINGPPDESPRERIRPRVVRRVDVARPPTAPLRTALREAESRFLTFQSSAVVRESTEVLSEFLGVLADLGAIDERLQEASGRRDTPYLVEQRLAFLNDHCRWLARRVSVEFLLLLQVHLERELKRIMQPEAYQLFLRLEEVEDASRETEAFTDRELMTKLRDGTLFREVLEQVRLGDVVGRRGRPGTMTEPSEPEER